MQRACGTDSVMHCTCIFDANLEIVRTTIRLDDDVAAAAQRLSREAHIGLGEAVNRLARAGLQPGRSKPRPFKQRTAELGLRVDVSNVADALELLDGAEHS